MKIATNYERQIVDIITQDSFKDNDRFIKIGTWVVNRQARRQMRLLGNLSPDEISELSKNMPDDDAVLKQNCHQYCYLLYRHPEHPIFVGK